ncbi:MAG TPA: hypothetical protein VGO28_01490 [Acidimicrobiia bacterium]
MPVSPATVLQTLPAEDSTPPVGDGQAADDRAATRKRRIALVGACVLAFAVGFAGMTALMRGSGSTPSSRTKTTQPAPAAGEPAAPPASTATGLAASAPSPPPSSALVDAVGHANDQAAPVPQSSPPPVPQTRNAGAAPTPSTTTSVPATTAPTTTPGTTTP